MKPAPRLLFVTGRLAEPALRRILEELGPRAGFSFEIAVLPISVIALATTRWIGTHLSVPEGIDRVILPGLCRGELTEVRGCTIERGPDDLRDLPEHFRTAVNTKEGYGPFDLEILAEINGAGQLGLDEILRQGKSLAADGADVIDLGCDPGGPWPGVGEAVRALRGEGLRVSIDSFDRVEVEAAICAGAELVLSVNSSNVAQAGDWGVEVVVVPDGVPSLEGMEATIDQLSHRKIPHRIDPILEPLGVGFAPSLGRYLEARQRWPDAAMMMGVGNVTELTDVDSAGVNVLLAGFCQEAGIRSVLTTQVVNWARSSVRELDLARRLMYFAVSRRMPPKRLEPGLVMLRDTKLRAHGAAGLAEIARHLKDRNYRIFAENGEIHVMNSDTYLHGDNPFSLFEQMDDVDPSHAFYLGYEMAKAVTALALGKNYTQDRALKWGMLTREESSG